MPNESSGVKMRMGLAYVALLACRLCTECGRIT
jgi:hypothetical protein